MEKIIRLLAFVLAAALSLVPDASATPPRSSHSRAVHAPSEHRCESCARTSSGRIRRITTVRRQFQRENPCPATGLQTGACPGYQVDHVIPLKRDGPNAPGICNGRRLEEARAKTESNESDLHDAKATEDIPLAVVGY